MIYHSPLHIFSDKDIISLDTASLKKRKKELLLKFDLTDAVTIYLKGKEYDKATVLGLFDELENNTWFHLKVFWNKDLLNFLEKGDLSFFKNGNEISWSDFDEAAFKKKITPYFIDKLGHIILKIIEHRNESWQEDLYRISNSEFLFLNEKRLEVYSASFDYLENLMALPKKDILDPFVVNTSSYLKINIKKYFNGEFLEILKALPSDIFYPIITSYGKGGWHLLNKAFSKYEKYSDFDLYDIKVLLNAAEACLFYQPNDKGIKELSARLSKYIDDRKPITFLEFFKLIFGVILFVVILLALMTNGFRKKEVPYHLSEEPYHLQDDSINISKTDLIGEWSYTFDLDEHYSKAKRSIMFFDEKKGYIEWELFSDITKSFGTKCCFVRHFDWSIKFGGPKRGTEIDHYKYYIQYQFDDERPIFRDCRGMISYSLGGFEMSSKIEKELTGRNDFSLDAFSMKDLRDSSQFLKLNKDLYRLEQ